MDGLNELQGWAHRFTAVHGKRYNKLCVLRAHNCEPTFAHPVRYKRNKRAVAIRIQNARTL